MADGCLQSRVCCGSVLDVKGDSDHSVTCERTGLLPLTGRFNPNHKSPRSFTESFLQHQHDHRVEGGAKKKKCANSAEPLPLETKSLRLLRPPRCLPAAERSASIHPCPVMEVQKHQKHSWHIRKQLYYSFIFLPCMLSHLRPSWTVDVATVTSPTNDCDAC